MCGRFSLAYSITEVCSRFSLALEGLDWKPRYNIAPTQECLVIVQKEHQKQIVPMVWGLIPSFSKSRSNAFNTINAKAETLKEKPAYKGLLQSRRCIIPADGFYEWVDTPSGKTPIRIVTKDQTIFSFAGLWDIWQKPDGSQLFSFTMITTQPNKKLCEFHDRMPVILTEENEKIWVDTKINVENRLPEILKPYPAEQMDCFEVSRVVNSWKNDVPECIQRLK